MSSIIAYANRLFADFRRAAIWLSALMLGAAFVLSGADSAAAAQEAIQVRLSQVKIIKAKDGKEQQVDATNVLPGDIVEYRVVYRNVSKGRVSGLLADLPIPEGLAYIAGSATPAANLRAAAVRAPTQASFAALPLMRKDAAGKAVPLPLSEYRVLRWTIGTLDPGAQVVVAARAKVIAPEPISAAARSNAQQAPPAKRANPK